MKNLLAAIALFVGTATFASAQQIQVKNTTVDYGNVEKGSNGERLVEFTNAGNAPLLIENAQGSCGCTVPSYPKEPIMPGETKSISIKYDTQRVGPFTKNVTLKTNSLDGKDVVITIKGTVLAEAPATPAKSKTFAN